jgi:hypothetical protein
VHQAPEPWPVRLPNQMYYSGKIFTYKLDRTTVTVGALSYGPPWAHYLGGCQDRLLGGPLGLPGLRYMTPEGVEHKDYTGVVLG